MRSTTRVRNLIVLNGMLVTAFAGAIGQIAVAEPQTLPRTSSGRAAQPVSASGLQKFERLNAQANKLFTAGNFTAAADLYRQALRLAPQDAQLHFNLALALAGLGDQQGERRELNRSVKLEPRLARAHNQLGLLAAQAGRQSEAEREFESAIAANPTYAEALNNLGALYAREGRAPDAVKTFRKAITADPKVSASYVNLALTLVKLDGIQGAERRLGTEFHDDLNEPGPFTALGVVLTKAGQGARAVIAFRKAVELSPDSSDTHLNLGMALVLQSKMQEGFHELTQAVRLNPNSAQAHLSLGHLYFETGKFSAARSELETACRLQPTLGDAFYFLALTERQENNFARAAELLQKVVILEPDNADAEFFLGQCLEKIGKTQDAIRHWKLATRAYPNELGALYNLARTLNRLHDPEAQTYMARFEELQKREQVGDHVILMRNLALESGKAQDWPQAIEQMRHAIEICGKCSYGALLHKNLAFFYKTTGKIDAAEGELQKAIELDPNDDNTRQALAALQSLGAVQSKPK
jgi:tetratricopeptide (TPR) repeat protein